MSYESAKGYRLEHDAVDYLLAAGYPVARPRTTSYRHTDIGDLTGLPLVVSCKNRARQDLGAWVREVETMVARSPFRTGVVMHKRPRVGPPGAQFVTCTLDLFEPLLATYCRAEGVRS